MATGRWNLRLRRENCECPGRSVDVDIVGTPPDDPTPDRGGPDENCAGLTRAPSIPAVGQRGNDPDGSVRLNVAGAPEDSELSGHSGAHCIAEPFDHAGFQSVTQMSRPVISNTRETIGLGRQTTRFPPSLITFRHAA